MEKSVFRRKNDDLVHLGELIKTWDPYALLSSGAPQDEFDLEINQVYNILIDNSVHSAEQLANHIAKIFYSSFGDENWTQKNCMDIAQTIWDWWQEQKAR